MAQDVTFDPSSGRRTLFEALLDARDAYGAQKQALEDAERTPLTYGRLVLGSLVLGRRLAAMTRPGECVGLLLPNAAGAVVTLFGLSAHGRVPAMLNFTAGPANLRSALTTAAIRTVVTSRRFIRLAELEPVVEALETADPNDAGFSPARIIYLEDVRKEIGALDKVLGMVRSFWARSIARRSGSPDDIGVILFTSGSEGRPKGVVLSHANIVSNVRQIMTHDGGGILLESDVVMNPLPMFHSFGLTGGTMLGLFSGMKVVLYPSPLHYKEVPKLIREVRATFLVGTDTFLRNYARMARPGDLDTVRLVVAGAEKVREDTRQAWQAIGATIIEGYGATECAPVLAVNSPRDNRAGTVGPALPGVEVQLDPIEGMEGGLLKVRGPNVMRGYMFADNPGQLVPPEAGWHDTGDVVTLDGDGYITIRGRMKRFAKVGGEMVSFAAVEGVAASLWPDHDHVVTSLPDKRKGEQLVLLTNNRQAERGPLLAHAKVQDFPELWLPRRILHVEEIPVLGSGKVNFGAVQDLAKAGERGAS